MNILETIVREQAKQDHDKQRPWKYAQWIGDANIILVLAGGPVYPSYNSVKDKCEENLGKIYIEERSKYD